MRYFHYRFEPWAQCPIQKKAVRLSVREIENSALKEIMQTPGISYGTWQLLDTLLISPQNKKISPFTFRQEIGNSREVKSAISGLIGRFVARAYLEKYFGLTIFDNISLSQKHTTYFQGYSLKRKQKGDLPDWICIEPIMKLPVIAEAKGSYNKSGLDNIIDNAFKQTGRIELSKNNQTMKIKRIAVASRWAVQGNPKLSIPLMHVKDPEEEGIKLSIQEKELFRNNMLRGDVVIARWFYLDSRLTAGYNVGLTYGDHHANIDASPTRSAA